ncbi:MAG: hypothetical protein QXH42_06375 [Thermoplasmata archaeon]
MKWTVLTTKYTYAYRALGALGAGLVLLGIFLPWANITDGRIGPFRAGETPTGWALAYEQQMVGGRLNIGGAIFFAVFGMVIFATFGVFAIAAGRNGIGLGYFLLGSSAFFVVFMVALLPYVQQGIPVPDDPLTPDKVAEIEALNATDPARGSELYSEALKLKEQRDKILEWKNLRMVPQYGLILSLAGSVLAYVFARLVVSDNAKLENYKRYAALLAQVHADGKVTKDEAELLARERQLLKLSWEEHELILRQTVREPASQQRLLEMHRRPVDVERILRDREFDSYRRALVQAYKDGKLTEDEAALLRVQRESLGITDADHDAILAELVASGEVTMKGPTATEKLARADTMATPPATPAAPPLRPAPSPSPPPPHSAREPAPVPPQPQPPPPAMKPPPALEQPSVPPPYQPAPPIQTPEAPPQPPVPSSSTPAPAPSSRSSAAPAPEASPESGATMKRVRCTKCRTQIPVSSPERPLRIKCPGCGFEGTLRK